jgi:hypothetical protein
MMEGIPTKVLTPTRAIVAKMLVPVPTSLRYIPISRPSGTPSTEAIATMVAVPVIEATTPPPVSPTAGASLVKKSQLMVPMPLTIRKISR